MSRQTQKRRERPSSFTDHNTNRWAVGTRCLVTQHHALQGQTLAVAAIDPYMHLVALPAGDGTVYWLNANTDVKKVDAPKLAPLTPLMKLYLLDLAEGRNPDERSWHQGRSVAGGRTTIAPALLRRGLIACGDATGWKASLTEAGSAAVAELKAKEHAK